MKYLLKIQEKIVPELISIVENRYTILRNIYSTNLVGRRALAEKPISARGWLEKNWIFSMGED